MPRVVAEPAPRAQGAVNAHGLRGGEAPGASVMGISAGELATSSEAGPVSATANPPNPRATMLTHLYLDMGAAIEAGDLDVAAMAHAIIGKLLAAAPPGTGVSVVDLADGRRRG